MKLTASIGADMFAVEGEFSADQILAAFRAWMVARRDPSADLNTLADALTTKTAVLDAAVKSSQPSVTTGVS